VIEDSGATVDQSKLPGRGEAPAIAEWAERQRAGNDIGESGAPRDIAAGGALELRPVTFETVLEISALQVEPRQRGSVAPNAVSLAEASFTPHAWFRGVYVDGTPVGFVLLWIDEPAAAFDLWRFMIDARYQGKGYGREALARIVDHVRGLPGASHLGVSWVPGPDGPEAFYRAFGFVPTGEIDDGEVVARLEL
jgi:diamine N-acetyltransferase